MIYFPRYESLYPFIFYSLIIIIIVLLFKNKKIVSEIKNLFSKKNLPSTMILIGILLFFFIYSLITINHYNNLLQTGIYQLFKVTEYVQYGEFINPLRPMGFASLLIPLVLINSEHLIIYASIYGIIFSLLNIFFLFLIIKTITKNNIIALIGPIIFATMPFVSIYNVGSVSSSQFSAFFNLFIIYLLLLPKKNSLDWYTIIFAGLLNTYIRVENVMILGSIGFLLLYENKEILKKNIFRFLLFSIVFILPQIFYYLNYKIFNNYLPKAPFNLERFPLRLMSFFDFFISNWNYLFILLFFIGIFVIIIEKKYSILLVFIPYFLLYNLYDVYNSLYINYVRVLLPLNLIIVTLGIYLFFNNLKKYKVLFVLIIILSVVIANPLSFQKTPNDYYINPHFEINSKISNSTAVLYFPTSCDYAESFKLLTEIYNTSIIIDKKKIDFPVEYLIMVREDFSSKIKNPKEHMKLEEITGQKLIFLENLGISYLYRVDFKPIINETKSKRE